MDGIVTVCEDLGATNVVAAIAQILSDRGYEIFPIVGGMGASRWFDQCKIPSISGDTEDYQSLLGVENFLKKYDPKVVIVGESFPNHLEGEFARVAQKLGIPVVLVGDFWGGFVRVGLVESPDMVVGLDEFDMSLIHDHFPKTRAVIAGNPGVQQEKIVAAPEVMNLRTNGNLVVTLCGGGSETAGQINLLLDCLEATGGYCKIIPRWHPSVADLLDPENSNRPYREVWDGMLAHLRDQVARFDELPLGEVLAGSHFVFSGYSTTLSTAAQLEGVIPVSLVTPQVQEILEAESAAREIPQVALHIAHRVDKRTDLRLLKHITQEARAKLMPFDPEKAARTISAIL